MLWPPPCGKKQHQKRWQKREDGMNIYVGNLSYSVTETELKQAFEEFGNVASVNILEDKYTGRSRGFGFVEMPEESEAQSAIEGLDGKELKGRVIKVNKARPRTEGRGGRDGQNRGWRPY
jgi:RNA recognition motif-containing protein